MTHVPSEIHKNESEVLQEKHLTHSALAKTSANNRPLKLTKGLKNFLKIVILHPECLEHKGLQDALDLVWCDEVKKYVATLRGLYFEIDEAEYPSMVQETLKGDHVPIAIKETVGAMLFHFKHQSLEKEIVNRMLKDIMVSLQLEDLKKRREELKLMQKNSDKIEDVHRILREINKIQKELETIKSKPNRNEKGV